MPAKKAVSTGRPPAPVAIERKRSLRLHGTIAQDIGVRIVSGRLRPGRVLNGEIEASAQLRVSRTAYREAVRILAAKGLVESRPKLGTRVSDPSRWHLLDPDVLGWMFTSHPDAEVLKSPVRVAHHHRARGERSRGEPALQGTAAGLAGFAGSYEAALSHQRGRPAGGSSISYGVDRGGREPVPRLAQQQRRRRAPVDARAPARQGTFAA